MALPQAASFEPTFLYPIGAHFPFDVLAAQVIRELEARSFRVPGLDVRFDVYGSGAQKMRLVREIIGDGFRLYFGRVQRLMPGGHYNDVAGLSDITVGKFSLTVYSDDSGPTFEVYVGADWEADRDKFVRGHLGGVHAKMYNAPRKMLRYKGAFYPPDHEKRGYFYTHTRAPYLNHDTDLGRLYSPVPLEEGETPNESWEFASLTHPDRLWPTTDAPSYMDTSLVFDYFTNWIEGTLLPLITAEPVREFDPAVFGDPRPAPVPEGFHIFTFGDGEDAHRIRTGQDPRASGSDLNERDQYGMRSTWKNSERLLHLGMRRGEGAPELAYEGFLWCGIGEVTEETPIDSLEVPGFYRWSDRMRYVIRIRPKSAHAIYVADWGEYEAARKAFWEAQIAAHSTRVVNWEGKPTKKLRRLKKYEKRYGSTPVVDKVWERRARATDADVAAWRSAVARTLVPLSEYKGGYKQPVALVDGDHEFGFDEVDLVSGPWPDRTGRL